MYGMIKLRVITLRLLINMNILYNNRHTTHYVTVSLVQEIPDVGQNDSFNVEKNHIFVVLMFNISKESL